MFTIIAGVDTQNKLVSLNLFLYYTSKSNHNKTYVVRANF